MKKVELLTFDYPDYFSGYPTPVISIPVYGTMTNKEVAKAIDQEIGTLIDMGVKDTDIAFYDQYIEKLLKEPDDIFVEYELTEAEENDDFFEPCCLFFGITNKVHSNGLTFLNP